MAAHIASCLAASASPILSSKPGSPAPGMYSTTPPTKSHMWRAGSDQQSQTAKYQLFPKDKPLPPIHDNDGPEVYELPDNRPVPSAGSRARSSSQNLTRRRKVSVPELGPMTTVQESAMDSPTIPGRPAIHERSISAPNEVSPKKPIQRKPVRMNEYTETVDDLSKAIDDAFELINTKDVPSQSTSHATPRHLAPLVIPKSYSPAPRLQPKRSTNHLRSGSTPPMDASRLARLESSATSHGRFTPDLPYSRSTPSDNMLPTPVSAPVVDSHRASPRPWEAYNPPSGGSERLYSDNSNAIHSHRRIGSEPTSNIMDRGRPRKRSGESRNVSSSVKSQESRQPLSAERRAFEELPKGMKVAEAAEKLSPNEIESLYRQALGQAERFEVLKAEDVDALSKELRMLDERSEYLRKTYMSLRSGRRNLHTRICQYLRATRVAKFSHESMLRQEEALSELDVSIDDWFNKLEQAENRRTRVRQKLLEHVAAASILPLPSTLPTPPPHPALQDVSTPPRSPTKHTFTPPRAYNSSPSPQRVVAQVPSTIIEHPVIEEAAAESKPESRSLSALKKKRSDDESLRAYAGDDLFDLLTDVEQEITRLSRHADDLMTPKATVAAPQFHEKSAKGTSPKKLMLAALPADPPATHGAYEQDGEYYLTNAVFKP